MSWDDFYRRRDALDAALRAAAANPAGPLPFDEVPGVAEEFPERADLLLALHYRWTLKLTGRLGLALAECERDPKMDRVDAVSGAWRAAAAEFPVLRGLLDAHAGDHAGVLRPVIESEQRMLALASGLADPGEPPAEITRVGAALLALVRSAPRRTRRRHPVEQLLRRLVTSA